MDLQYIGERRALIAKYCCGYATKHEKGPCAEIWRAVGQIKNEVICSKMWQYGLRALKEREIGIAEALDHLLGHLVVKFSYGDKPVFLNCNLPSCRHRSGNV